MESHHRAGCLFFPNAEVSDQIAATISILREPPFDTRALSGAAKLLCARSPLRMYAPTVTRRMPPTAETLIHSSRRAADVNMVSTGVKERSGTVSDKGAMRRAERNR